MCREKTINFLPLLARCRRGGAYESGSVGQQVECLCDFFLNGQNSDSKTPMFCNFCKQKVNKVHTDVPSPGPIMNVKNDPCF